MGRGVWGEVGGRVEGGLKEGGGVSLCFFLSVGYFWGHGDCVLGRGQVVCEAHVEAVAGLRAEVVEDGLDLAQGH